jgi:hypothetical protein
LAIRATRANEAAMKRKLTTLAIFGMLFALAIANAMASNVWLHAPYTGSG